MKAKMMIGMLVGMVLSVSAMATEAVLDTGPGGIKVSFSLTDNMAGPYDFARNKGPKVASSNGLTVGEVAFNAGSGVGGTLVYKGGVMRRTQVKPGDQLITPEHLAKVMLEQNGFTLARATVVPNGPKVNIEGMLPAITYKAIGDVIFEGKTGQQKALLCDGRCFYRREAGLRNCGVCF